MTELIMEISIWLLVAIALGFIFGWLLSKVIGKRKHDSEIESLNSILKERNEMLNKLEKKIQEERVIFEKVSDELKNSDESLAQKISLATQLQAKLKKKNSMTDSIESKEYISILEKELKELKRLDKKRVKELEEFELVLVKAEEIITKNQKKDKELLDDLEYQVEVLTLTNDEKLKTIELYQETIAEFEKELKLYTATSKDDEFVISKDQFLKIEEQLERYQKEIVELKKINSEFVNEIVKIKPEDELFIEEKELDDGSIVKLFRETYKKITKS